MRTNLNFFKYPFRRAGYIRPERKQKRESRRWGKKSKTPVFNGKICVRLEHATERTLKIVKSYRTSSTFSCYGTMLSRTRATYSLARATVFSVSLFLTRCARSESGIRPVSEHLEKCNDDGFTCVYVRAKGPL